MMAEAVIHPKLIQARLGHTAIRMTLNLYGGGCPPTTLWPSRLRLLTPPAGRAPYPARAPKRDKPF
jgi:hypothetical protein